jgi:TonB family protein
VYPALAMKAGIEGIVWVKIWVDKTGKPRDVVIMKSEQEILNKSTLDAAWQFRFTPAYVRDKPVDVWVSVPFKFKLAEKREANKTVIDTVHSKFPEEVMEFARKVLEGGSPDTGSVSRFVAEGAQAIAGGYLKPLVQALEEQRSGKQSIEQPRRLVVFCTGGMSDDGRSGYVVARTESAGKDSRLHYHTIVIQQNADGGWKIVHWHTWHSSR